MLKCANIYRNSKLCLPFEEFHKPAVPRYFGAAVVFDVPKLTASAAHQNHKMCGDLSCTDSSHTNAAWTELSSFTSGTLSEGSYYLTSNITLSSNITISGEVNLCLNGNTINANNNSRVISIEEGGTLNLCDCSSGQAGKLTGGNCTLIASGGCVCNSGTFNMYGGTISGNPTGKSGGGVYATAVL